MCYIDIDIIYRRCISCLQSCIIIITGLSEARFETSADVIDKSIKMRNQFH